MADTFDSRLKLRLQESGANSGQWGTLLNQTITNIASVFGFGTHQLTSDADATLTLSDDGASVDALKSSYLKITSSVSLTATRTLQFSPNTLNQVKYIENATSGSQSITISQGSGANVTIASGKTAVVYFDGAGSGAAVVDALAGVDPGVTDTLAEVLSAGNATGGTDIAVGTGDNITFADSSKAIFGAGSDLEIYHTASGNHSIIEEVGGGNLVVRTNGPHIEFDKGSTEFMARMLVDGAVELYYDSALKLATTSTGVDVTGTLTVNNFASLSSTTLTIGGEGGANGIINSAESIYLNIDSNNNETGKVFRIGTNDTGTGGDAIAQFSDNGDISFYDGSGNAAFFWDSSAAALGIGGSPNTPLQVSGANSSTNADALFSVQKTTEGYGLFSGVLPTGVSWLQGGTSNDATYYNVALQPNGGNVGIGDSNPARLLSLNYDGEAFIRIQSSNTGNAGLEFGDQADSVQGAIFMNASDNSLRFNGFNNSEAMRIDSSENLLVGKSNTTFSNNGIELRGSNGGARFIRSNAEPILMNRTGSDGAILGIYKDGTSVGSISSTDNSGIIIGSQDVGLRFRQQSAGASVFPRQPDGSALDATLDLGISNSRFKDLYLSGKGIVGPGSSSAPSITASNDTDAGLFWGGGFLGFTGGNAKSMRLDASGNFLVGKSSNAVSTDGTFIQQDGKVYVTAGSNYPVAIYRSNGNGRAIGFYSGTALAGWIEIDSSSAVSINSSSDQRLKENIQDAEDAGELIDAIQVRQFDWKVDGEHQRYGMVAQELTTVAPEAVSTPEDTNEMMGVDYSKLVPMLIKEIQTLRTRVAQLENN